MTVTIDQQFIEYIVKSLVGKPEAVKVDRSVDEKGVLLELTVDPEDIGRVIGKRGSTAQSLRALLRALGTKNDARYNLKIVDVDRPESERGTPRQRPAQADDDGGAAAAAPVAVAASADDDGDNLPDEPVEKESDLAKKTRAEFADLDDLDI
jgi:predicted RNA-binding protein YlqC (UPF0109 family)